MEITFERLVISKRLVDDVNTVMQLQDDVERELRMDFISRILKNVMLLSLVARDFLDICIWGTQLLI